MSSWDSFLEELMGTREKTESAPTAPTATAIAGARVSTLEQKERGLSIAEQLREIRDYAKSNHIEIVAEFIEAESAFQRRVKRPEFEGMLARAKAEHVSMIIAHDFSKFSRDSVRAKAPVRQLREVGIKVVSLNDPEIDPETPTGIHMEAFTFAKNEAYSLATISSSCCYGSGLNVILEHVGFE
jgi:DNA invertase Pin-like site-specific DNA recombinase